MRNGNNTIPAATAKYETQGSDPFSRHLCKRQPPDEVDVVQALLIEGAHDEIAPASKSGHTVESGSMAACRRRVASFGWRGLMM